MNIQKRDEHYPQIPRSSGQKNGTQGGEERGGLEAASLGEDHDHPGCVSPPCRTSLAAVPFKQLIVRIESARGFSSEAVQNADLVIEAIIENLKIKQDLFAFLDSKAK